MRKMEHIYKIAVCANEKRDMVNYCERMYKIFQNGKNGFFVTPGTDDFPYCRFYYCEKSLLVFEWRFVCPYETYGYGVDAAVKLREADAVLLFDNIDMDYLLSLVYGEIAEKMKCYPEQFGSISMNDLDSEFPLLKVLSYCLEIEFTKLQEEKEKHYRTINNQSAYISSIRWLRWRRENHNPVVAYQAFDSLQEILEDEKALERPVQKLREYIENGKVEISEGEVEVPNGMKEASPAVKIATVCKDMEENLKKKNQVKAEIHQLVYGYQKKNIQALLKSFEEKMVDIYCFNYISSAFAEYVVKQMENVDDDETVIIDGENQNLKKYYLSFMRHFEENK